jgi:hypothetical protein
MDMSDEDNKRRELGRAIVGAIDNVELEMNTVFAALNEVFIYYMSQVCHVCRKNIAKKLKRDVPHMLMIANRCASISSDTPNCH